jgi:hypothetical protein
MQYTYRPPINNVCVSTHIQRYILEVSLQLELPIFVNAFSEEFESEEIVFGHEWLFLIRIKR